MSKQGTKNQKEYYLGLDIGTNSVGWAVTDLNYELLKANKKDLWGVRLFDTANTAKARRLSRVGRRRHMRKLQRLRLLREIFAPHIEKKDPLFFDRLKESAYHLEDKSTQSRPSLFNDPGFTDKEYHLAFPTLYHLRKALMNGSDYASDIRLVYLAIHHILKSRGHFLFAGESFDASSSFDSLHDDLILQTEDLLNVTLTFNTGGIDNLKAILKMKRKNDKRSALQDTLTLVELEEEEVESDPKTLKAEIIKALIGSAFSLSKLFNKEEYKENELDKVEFEKDNYEENKPLLEELLEGDEFVLLETLEGIFNWVRLDDVLRGESFLSNAKVVAYNEHKDDINQLKSLIRQYKKESFYQAFKDPKVKYNYAHYIGVGYKHGEKLPITHTSKCSQEEVNKYFKTLLQDINNPADTALQEMLAKLELSQALPKQRIRDNRIIPRQLHNVELKAILEHASKVHPFLLIPDEDGYSPKEKILSIMNFRIPYYVGPLNTAHMKENGMEGFSWMVRREGEEETKIRPWNWEKVVDTHASAEKFITRMTNTCTYLIGKPVLPKYSLLYQRYMVLNELNNVKINNELIDTPLKQQIYEDLFIKAEKKSVTLSALKRYLISQNIINKQDAETVTGVDKTFTSSLKSLLDFHEDYLEPGILTEDDVENIIEWKAYYVDDASILKQKIKEELGSKLTTPQIDDIAKKVASYKGWGRLSKALLTEVYEINQETGEVVSIIQKMWNESVNLMELLSSKYAYATDIDALNQEHLMDKAFTYDALVKPLAASPSVKRQIWQTLLVVREIRKIQGHAPKRIFLEMAREEGEKKQTKSRKESLQELYAGCKGDIQFNKALTLNELKDSLEKVSLADLRRDTMYFYYTQLGRCMYCNESIDLQTGDYDIDHIYPQSVIKDDSLNNRVLTHKKCNGKKGDIYPLAGEVREKMKGLWDYLLKNEFISKEKHFRLTRTTPLNNDDLFSFINRQLVETRQSSKQVATILKDLFGDEKTELVYVKSRNVTEFRNDYEIKKSRSINDFHHAHDAYLNIVVGNVHHTKFTANPWVFVKEWAQDKIKFNASNLYAFNVVRNNLVAWEADSDYKNNKGRTKQDKRESGTILTVRKTLRNPRVLVTRQTVQKGGQLFDLQPLRKGGKSLIPLKASHPVLSNTNRYGGYQTIKTAYFALIEFTKNRQRARRLIAIPVLYANAFEKDEAAIKQYCEEYHNLHEPTIILPKVLINEVVKVKGYPMTLSGITVNRIAAATFVQLVLDESTYDYLCQVEKFDSLQGKMLKKKKDEQLTEKEKQQIDLMAESIGITREGNLKIYDSFYEKESKTIYNQRPANQTQFLAKSRARFNELSIEAQCKVILQMLKLFRCSPESADLRLIGGVENAGVVLFNSVLKNQTELVHYSPTGIFSKTIRIDTT